jgi:outer membrane protein assembly factor BamB
VATFNGRVFALDMEGQEMWSTQLMAGEGPDGEPRKATLDAPPACFDNSVYVATARGVLHALDTSNGAERWKLETEGTFLATPNYGALPGGEGKFAVYAMSQDDGTVFAVDPDSGSLLWSALGPERCDGAAAVFGENIVFGSCAAALHIVNANDGEHVRDIPIDEDSQVAGGVAIADGSVYSGTRSGKFLHAELKTGLIRWTNLDCEDEIFSTPAVFGDVVVFTGRDGAAYCLDRATGKLKWKFETEGEPQSPIIVDGKVVFSSGGTLYLLRLETGEEIWSRKVSDKLSSPAVLNNLLVVSSEDGSVTAFGAPQSAEE